MSSRLFECICSMRPTRSFLSRDEFSSDMPVSILPEYRRQKVSEPTKGSSMILNARTDRGSSSEALRVTGSSVR
ncbi:hypothetical protein D3C72_1341020 [compost metagenome]